MAKQNYSFEKRQKEIAKKKKKEEKRLKISIEADNPEKNIETTQVSDVNSESIDTV